MKGSQKRWGWHPEQNNYFVWPNQKHPTRLKWCFTLPLDGVGRDNTGKIWQVVKTQWKGVPYIFNVVVIQPKGKILLFNGEMENGKQLFVFLLSIFLTGTYPFFFIGDLEIIFVFFFLIFGNDAFLSLSPLDFGEETIILCLSFWHGIRIFVKGDMILDHLFLFRGWFFGLLLKYVNNKYMVEFRGARQNYTSFYGHYCTFVKFKIINMLHQIFDTHSTRLDEVAQKSKNHVTSFLNGSNGSI